MIDFFLSKIREFPEREAVISSGAIVVFGDLDVAVQQARDWLSASGIPPGAVVSFDGDYSPAAIALFLALAENKNVVVPLSSDSARHFEEFREIAMSQYDISIDGDAYKLQSTGREAEHEHYAQLSAQNCPGLVLFSSGSTGKSKAIVQNLDRLMSKFQVPRSAQRMLIFLQLDHIGGVNSLLYTLANQGTLIVSADRSPEQVCETIQKYRVELLPTSPTFLNLVMLSRAHTRFDLASLKLITYGTEPMQASTLQRLSTELPDCRLQQTYGLSEVGILRSKSRSSDSLWMKVGGDEFETKIQNGTLWIRSESAMLGYINAPDPFDADGFLDTGDIVEQDGEWIRILGRESEIINVGGSKVYPAEVESLLLTMDNVEDVVVYAEAHPLTGEIVAAKFNLEKAEPLRQLKTRMLQFCKTRLPAYKIPGKLVISEEHTYNERFKRMRRLETDHPG